MKRILLSIGLALAFLVVYLTITSVFVVLSKYDRNLIAYVQIPVRLPQMLYYYFFPPIAEDYQIVMTKRKAILMVLSFTLNVLLYSIPIYFLLGLISKLRKPKPTETEVPPPPCSIDILDR